MKPGDLESMCVPREISRHNVGLFATRNIRKGDLIFTESPFLDGYLDIMMSYMQRQNPTGGRDPKVDEECRAIQHEIQLAVASKSAGEAQVHSQESLSRLMDRLSVVFISERFRECSLSQQELWMSLHDQHQVIPTAYASPVGIFDLVGEQGRWNGKIGVAKSSRQGGRYFEVEVENEVGQVETLLVSRENLKTPAGILRSNSFEDGGLFQLRCRINHSCRPNTHALLAADAALEIPGVVARDPREIVVVAARDIREGEELTNSYFNFSPGQSAAARRDILSSNFGFECWCQLCTANEALPGSVQASCESRAPYGRESLDEVTSTAR